MSVKQKHFFVVDDDEMMAAMLSDHLRLNPLYVVTVFNTGEDCIRQLALDPDVIILDYQLNSVMLDAADGMEIMRQIKKIDEDVRIIMLSSQEEYGTALQAIIKGALEYVVKDTDTFKRIDHILEHQG